MPIVYTVLSKRFTNSERSETHEREDRERKEDDASAQDAD